MADHVSRSRFLAASGAAATVLPLGLLPSARANTSLPASLSYSDSFDPTNKAYTIHRSLNGTSAICAWAVLRNNVYVVGGPDFSTVSIGQDWVGSAGQTYRFATTTYSIQIGYPDHPGDVRLSINNSANPNDVYDVALVKFGAIPAWSKKGLGAQWFWTNGITIPVNNPQLSYGPVQNEYALKARSLSKSYVGSMGPACAFTVAVAFVGAALLIAAICELEIAAAVAIEVGSLLSKKVIVGGEFFVFTGAIAALAETCESSKLEPTEITGGGDPKWYPRVNPDPTQPYPPNDGSSAVEYPRRQATY